MALVLQNVYQTFSYFFTEYKDPRVEQYPLLGSPWPIVTIIVLYLKFVNDWGHRCMANRKPFHLKSVMNVYNLVQIVLNLYIGFVGGLNSYFAEDFSWKCESINQKDGISRRKLIFVTYLYFLSKIIDLLDTVFFVLRKKYSQITFLHIYHHAGMVIATYIFTKFLAVKKKPLLPSVKKKKKSTLLMALVVGVHLQPFVQFCYWSKIGMNGSHATLLGLINSFVHVIMYFYYFLTSFKPELKDSLWWKKHITQVQLIQFTLLMLHFGIPLVWGYCDFPKVLLFIGFTQNMFMFTLFADFYIKAYLKQNKPISIKKLFQ